MDGLRCWVGALCITKAIVNPHNDGKFVTCLEYVGFMPWWDGPNGEPVNRQTWRVDREMPRLNQEGKFKHYRWLVTDRSLTPITPPPATDTTTTDTPADALEGA
jgi:hypothetical protein